MIVVDCSVIVSLKIFCEESDGADVVREAVDCGGACELTDCVRVFDLTASPDPSSDTSPVYSSDSELIFCASQTLSFTGTRSATGTLVCAQSKSKDECRRAARQGSARSGQEQAYTAKCPFESGTFLPEGTPLH